MTEQIEQLLLSEQDSNIRLGLTLYFSQGGSIVDFSKWLYIEKDVFYQGFLHELERMGMADKFGLDKSIVYLINYIKENFKISRFDFKFIAQNIKYIRCPENTDISLYLDLLVNITHLMKKIKKNLVNNLQ